MFFTFGRTCWFWLPKVSVSASPQLAAAWHCRGEMERKGYKKGWEIVGEGRMENWKKVAEGRCKHGKLGSSRMSHGKLSCVMWWIMGWAGINFCSMSLIHSF